MPVTMQDVLAEIDRDEPNYSTIATLGPEALPHLEMIVDAQDPLRAAKATYAASLIGGEGSVSLLRKAAEHRDPQVRIAAASGLRNASSAAPTEVLERLLDDADVGVRKIAVGTAGALGRAELRTKVQALAADDPHEFLRTAAATAARSIK
ncbi:MAG: HEAT repeat domain-containing protein [Actinomycetota bacterium]|nr:HEAT repeat domain-containing protein [Actinomycetota bacterium]